MEGEEVECSEWRTEGGGYERESSGGFVVSLCRVRAGVDASLFGS